MHQISTILSKVIQELEPNPCFRQFHSLENSISPLIIQEAFCLRQWLKPSITTYVQLAAPPPPSPPPDTLLCSYVWLHWAGYPYTGRFGVVYLKPVEYMSPFCIYTLYSGFNKQHRNCNQGPYTALYSIAACSETVLKHKLFELLSEFWSLVAISPPNDLFPTAHSEPHTCWACVCLLEKVKDNSELYL